MKFYVYELVDPRNGEVFYVGKGQKRRLFDHEADASKGVHSRKCDMIRSIWADHREVDRRIVSRHDDENEALQAEFDLIVEYGLDNLTNVLPGGIMGAQVDLAHLAAAQQRKALKDKERLRKDFEQIAPQIAMVLRARVTGKQVGAWVGARWIDFTEAFYDIFMGMIHDLGFEFARSTLAPHGVDLREA